VFVPDLKQSGYAVIDLPPLTEQMRSAFEDLPLDDYTGGRQRYRRFSQYRMTFSESDDTWVLELLPHRPFVQAPDINGLVGGVPRPFEPLQIDPTAQIDAGAKALELSAAETWQINVHQCRVISNDEITGVSVPEGPHRDGHAFGMLAVFGRRNIEGGENELLPSGGGEPFFRVELQPDQALVYDDTQMWHNATDIRHTDPGGGHRDLWIVAFNPWEDRKYGDEFERGAQAPAADLGGHGEDAA
jgi:hypothetical protein